MKRHITFLVKKFDSASLTWKIFKKYCRFVSNPFGTSVGDLPLQDNLLQEQFIDLMNDENARSLFS